jgi:EAL domain-containing protein (putative c-di-GMP-specific phosphodiesterase class I)
VAEGVETPEQLAALRDLGCDWAQGYHLARPGPAEDVTTLLKDGTRW